MCVIYQNKLLRTSPLIFPDLVANLSLFIRKVLLQHHPKGDRFWRAMLENNLKKGLGQQSECEEGNFPQAAFFFPSLIPC